MVAENVAENKWVVVTGASPCVVRNTDSAVRDDDLHSCGTACI